MEIFQEVRIRTAIALRLAGVIPMLQWVKLELNRRKRKRLFVPKRIPEDSHVLIFCAYYEHPEWVKGMIQLLRRMRIAPACKLSMEKYMGWIADDEYLEVTPKALRVWKVK